MTNIKTPEEIANGLANEICFDFQLASDASHTKKAQDEWNHKHPDKDLSTVISDRIARSISAERNANLEKIERSKEQLATLGNKYFMDGVDSDTKIKSLESKLAEAEKKHNLLNDMHYPVILANESLRKQVAELESKLAELQKEADKACNNYAISIAKLEAEAKAIRSKTIEICAQIADNNETPLWVARDIRALNSEKEV